MEVTELLERLSIYFRSLKHYVLGIILFILFLIFYSYLTQVTVDKLNNYSRLSEYPLNFFKTILVVVPLYLIGKMHIQIGRSLFRNAKKQLLLSLPVFLTWILLLVFKFYVNEVIHTDFGGYGGYGRGLPDIQRFLNYIFFSIWTAIFLWEVYYRVFQFFLRSKHTIK